MQLLVVRHGIAEERNARRWPGDTERPLSAQGLLRSRHAAAGLRRVAPRPVRMLVSPLARTRQTAAILTQCAGWPEATACALLEPGHASEPLLALLARGRESCIAIVGHEPDLGRFIAACLPRSGRGATIELRKMGAALIEFEGQPRAGRGHLEWLLSPKLLRALRRLPARR
jgi:phosphohistidine phosphatase